MNIKRLFFFFLFGLFICVLVLSLFIRQNLFLIKTKAQSPTILNNEVMDLIEGKVIQNDKKKFVLSRRYEELLKLMKKDRAQFFGSLLSKDVIAELEKKVTIEQRGLFEEYVNAEGTLTELIADFPDGSSETQYKISINDKVYNLISLNEKLPSGVGKSLVKINGVMLGSFITPLNSENSLELLHLTSTANRLPIPENEYLYILNITFSNQTSSPFTNDELSEKVFGSTNSVKEFYRVDYYGKSSIAGNVFSFDILNTTYNCNEDSLAEQADSRLRSALGRNDIYGDRRVYIFSRTPCFGWAGLAEVGGNRVWISGYNEVSIYAHELGHNYGLYHANSLGCNDKQFDEYGKCKELEYGNPFDVLGHGWFGNYHSQGYYKYWYGWIENKDIQTISRTGVYRVNTIETTDSTLPQSLKIRLNSQKDDYYYIDYRTKGQLERNDPVRPLAIEPNIDKGLSINLIAENYTRQTRLIDNTPQTVDDSAITRIIDDDFADSSLVVNNTFVDDIHGIGVTLIGKTQSNADILVTFKDEVGSPEADFRDYVYPNPPKVTTRMNSQDNTLIFSWVWTSDRSCAYHCVDPVGYCTSEGLLSSHVIEGKNNRFGNTCNPVIGPFTWDVAIKGETSPRFFLRSNSDKNVTQTPQSTEFVFPCNLVTSQDIYNRAVFMRIWTTDGAGNKTGDPLVIRGVCR